ncbi:hypothetical protein K469DRAFT_611525, partial [Zopfia rhizophila CBS 207.26]
TLFARVCHLLPERDFLADALFQPTPLQSNKGKKVVESLVCLYQADYQVAYHPNMRPKDGHCPVLRCSKPMNM